MLKQVITVTAALVLSLISFNLIAQCELTLTLYDGWSDGWEGSNVTVSVNGSSVLTGVTLTNTPDDISNGTDCSNDFPFTAADGDQIMVTYTLGSGTVYPLENAWEIKDGNGNVLASDGNAFMLSGGACETNADEGPQPSTSSGPYAVPSATCPCHPDFDALVALYNSTDGANWTNNSGWVDGAAGTNCDPCSWYGVNCDGTARVGEIDFGNIGNNLSGHIPPEIGQLSNLTRLWVGNDPLSGPIPPEIGQLSNLVELGLYANQISGNIPAEIGQLTNLTTLWLLSTQLDGNIPVEIGQLGNLSDLRLFANQLSGTIPPEIGQLINLTYLDLFGNELSGSIPPEIGQLNNLSVLRLQINQLTGAIPPGIGQLGNLSELSLNNNQLTGDIPPEIGQFGNLYELNLGNNQLTGGIPAGLGQMNTEDGVFILNLGNNQLTGGIPVELGQFSTGSSFIFELRLDNNQLNGCIPSSFQNYCALDPFDFFISFSGNPSMDNDDFDAYCSSGLGECVSGNTCPEDINGDGVVDVLDFIELNSAFGAPCD